MNGIQNVFHAASILEIETVSLQYILLTTRTNCHNDLHFLGDGATRHDEGGSHAIRSAFVPALWALAKVLLAGSVGIAFGVLVDCLRKRRKKHRPRADVTGCVLLCGANG